MDTIPLTLVIFGASGDLTSRKLVPSLYRLDRKKRLPPETKIVGVARSPFSDDAFRDRMGKAIQEHAKSDWDAAAWAAFAPRLHYVAADAAKPAGLGPVNSWLKQREGNHPGRRLFYLAVGPDLYPAIVTNLGQEGLNRDDGAAWSRLIIEKPFGRDLSSARALNQTVRQNFNESHVYRIDHYLGKETVQNILVFRFANTLFEPVWNYNFIDHVQITVSETVALEGRGDYYDRSGVLRDMFQNHLLQLLTLVAMEAPSRFAADPLRNEKVKVLDAVPISAPDEAVEHGR
jgi:glucose-6-phosphate 1-dehydrogenase